MAVVITRLIYPANLLRHVIQRDTFFSGYMSLSVFMRPRAENQQAPRRDGIEESVGWFVVISETIIGKVNDGKLLFEENRKHRALLGADERGYHDSAFARREDATVHIVSEGLVVAMCRCFQHCETNMDGRVASRLQESDIAHCGVGAVSYLDAFLDTEIAGF